MPATFDIRQWMDIETLAAFDAAVKPRRYDAGQTIYTQGDQGTEMFRIASGSVRLSVTRSDGREVIFLFFEPGDCFGDSSLVDDEVRPQTAEAMTDTVLEALDKPAFVALQRDHRNFDHALMHLLARQMRVVSTHYVDTSLNDLPSRVAARILEAARAFGATDARGTRVTLRLSQSDLASMVGASRQSVNKTLQVFQARDIIAIEGHSILVRDGDALRRLAQAD